MEVHNAVTPTAEQIEGFLAPDAAEPIYMVNLLKFKAHAEYEDGRETSLSGREAYMLYATEVAKVITQVGGKLTFGAEVKRLMLGEVAYVLLGSTRAAPTRAQETGFVFEHPTVQDALADLLVR